MSDKITWDQLKTIERFADALLKKFGVDIGFTRHFIDRVNDDRNKPSIDRNELVSFFQKLAKSGAKEVKSVYKKGEDQAVLVDLQRSLNLPAVFNLSRDGKLEIVLKTIMRKKNFMTSNPKILVKELEELLTENLTYSNKPYGISVLFKRGLNTLIISSQCSFKDKIVPDHAVFHAYSPTMAAKKGIGKMIEANESELRALFDSPRPEANVAENSKYSQFRFFLTNIVYWSKIPDWKHDLHLLTQGLDILGKSAFTKKVCNGKGNLYTYLTTSRNLPDASFIHLYGGRPELGKGDVEGVEKVGRFVVTFGDVVSKKNKDEIKGTLTRAEKILDRYGLGQLTNVPTRVIKIQKGYAGLYYPSSDSMDIAPSTKIDNYSLTTIIHELGHRFYFTVPQVKSEAIQQYEAIKGVGSKYPNIISRYDLVKEIIVEDFRKGFAFAGSVEDFLKNSSYLRFVGKPQKKFGLTKNAIVIPMNVRADKVTFLSFADKEAALNSNSQGSFTFSTKALFENPDYAFELIPSRELRSKIVDYNPKAFSKPAPLMVFPKLKQEEPSTYRKEGEAKFHGKAVFAKDWHVTDYSKTNIDEWFAELFVYYILGQLDAGDPKNWMKGIIQRHKGSIK